MACIILASGTSRRFGELDKLKADLCGKPVLSHVLETATKLNFGHIYCVSQATGTEDVTWVKNDNPELGQGHALRLGLMTARNSGWASCVLMLGDMPLVPVLHIEKLIEKSYTKQSVVSVCETVRMPPVLFNCDAMDVVLAGNSVEGAKVLFDKLDLTIVRMEAEYALDVDTRADLAKVASLMKSRKI